MVTASPSAFARPSAGESDSAAEGCEQGESSAKKSSKGIFVGQKVATVPICVSPKSEN